MYTFTLQAGMQYDFVFKFIVEKNIGSDKIKQIRYQLQREEKGIVSQGFVSEGSFGLTSRQDFESNFESGANIKGSVELKLLNLQSYSYGIYLDAFMASFGELTSQFQGIALQISGETVRDLPTTSSDTSFR